jgi:hypothetical protein
MISGVFQNIMSDGHSGVADVDHDRLFLDIVKDIEDCCEKRLCRWAMMEVV